MSAAQFLRESIHTLEYLSLFLTILSEKVILIRDRIILVCTVLREALILFGSAYFQSLWCLMMPTRMLTIGTIEWGANLIIQIKMREVHAMYLMQHFLIT